MRGKRKEKKKVLEVDKGLFDKSKQMGVTKSLFLCFCINGEDRRPKITKKRTLHLSVFSKETALSVKDFAIIPAFSKECSVRNIISGQLMHYILSFFLFLRLSIDHHILATTLHT